MLTEVLSHFIQGKHRTEQRRLLHSLSSSFIHLFIKCPRLLTSAAFKLQIQMNLSLAQTNSRLKSYVRLTLEMSPREDIRNFAKIFKLTLWNFASLLQHLTVGLSKFDLRVKCKVLTRRTSRKWSYFPDGL